MDTPIARMPSGAISAVILVSVLAASCASRSRLPSSWVADEAANYHLIDDGLATANAITPAAVPKLASAGFKTIIDLRLPTEVGVAEESVAARGAGICYVSVPVTLGTLSGAQVRAVGAVLDEPANRPVLMHCSSGNRVGAVMALYREKIRGADNEAARNEARAVGLRLPEAIEAVERVRAEMGSAN